LFFWTEIITPPNFFEKKPKSLDRYRKHRDHQSVSFIHKFDQRHSLLHSCLCIGLDPEYEKLPIFLKKEREPLFVFLKEIVDATAAYAVSYKPNIAFFERFGSHGIAQFEKLIRYIHNNHPNIPVVADIKRGDLANTSKEYAKYYFHDLCLDSLTLSPYMGLDSLEPFLEYEGKMLFLLCLTSNKGSTDLQRLPVENKNFYEHVAFFTSSINDKNYPSSAGLVVGATHANDLSNLRSKHPTLFFLIPGVGAQGASLKETVTASGKYSLVNSSRGIIFASGDKDFAEKAGKAAELLHKEFNELFLT
jgi:orotidine-5'-phosphate decarboxylase